MKKTFFILGTALVLLSSFTGSVKSGGEDVCKAFFPMEKGTTLVYESYNGKDKLQSTDEMTVTDLLETPESTVIKVNMTSADQKGKETSSIDVEYVCEDGEFRMSLESLTAQMTENYKDMEITMTQNELILPSNMKVGQELPDADMEVKISSNGMQVTSINFKITERKVEAIENITTTAGTFECYKLSQKTNNKIMFIDKTYKTVDWFAEGIGSVRSEIYTESGKLESYRVLTNIKR